MKKYLLTLLIMLLGGMFLYASAPYSWAANHYIRDGASGDGSDWTNAWDDLPATLVRGDTYYIADGLYCQAGYEQEESYRFDDEESGTSYITIKKATVSEHGTNTGWSNDYGDGQAVFVQMLRFTTGYYKFDGAVSTTPSDSSSYGFKVIHNSDPDQTQILLWIRNTTKSVGHIEIKNTAFCGAGGESPWGTMQAQGICVYGWWGYCNTDITISNNYFYGSTQNLYILNCNTVTVDNNWFDANWSNATWHGEQFEPLRADSVTVSNNVFKDSKIAVIFFHETDSNDWNIYNNIVIGGSGIVGIFAATSGTTDYMRRCHIHHNTIVNVDIGGYGFVRPQGLTDPDNDRSYVYNNLFYNCSNAGFSLANPANVIYDYNAYIACSSLGSYGNEAIIDADGADPFTDATGYDFTLTYEIGPGKSGLGSPFDIDRAGKTFGADGIITIGAYEYQTGVNLYIPNGGESYTVGLATTITWENSGIDSLIIQFSSDGGSNWTDVDRVAASDEAYSWTPDTATSQGLIRLVSTVNEDLYDESDGVFVIEAAVDETETVLTSFGKSWGIGKGAWGMSGKE